MLQILISALSCTKTVLYYILAVNLFVGKTIFEFSSVIITKCFGFLIGFSNAAQILLEDFGIFLKDLLDKAGFGIQLIYQMMDTILYYLHYTTLSNYAYSCIESISKIITSIINLHYDLFGTILSIITFCKKFIVLLGSGVWFALTIIPITIVSTTILCHYYIGVLVEELKSDLYSLGIAVVNAIKSGGMFFIDVPLEAVLGLCFIGCLTYVICRFHIMLAGFILQYIRTAQGYVKWKLAAVCLKNPIRISSHADTSKKTERNEDITTCIICHEKPKCMLILPCKHLCTCQDCINKVRQYSGKCPLCRTDMNNIVQVYL